MHGGGTPGGRGWFYFIGAFEGTIRLLRESKGTNTWLETSAAK